MIRKRIVDRVDLRIGEQLLIRTVRFGNAERARGVFGLPQISGSDRVYRSAFAFLHGRDYFLERDSGSSQNSPTDFVADWHTLELRPACRSPGYQQTGDAGGK